MFSDYKVLVKTAVGFFIGGAGGAIANFLTAAQGDLSKVDWHKLFLTAAGMGVLTTLTHWFPPPSK